MTQLEDVAVLLKRVRADQRTRSIPLLVIGVLLINYGVNGFTAHPIAWQTSFQEALDDDLNISGALGHLFDTIRESNRLMDQGEFTAADARALLNWWSKTNQVLAFEADPSAIPAEIQALVDARALARKGKDWAAGDQLRDQLAALGWEVKDTKEGQRVTRSAT